MITPKQKTIILAGIACLVILALYVPWAYTLDMQQVKMEKSAGYSFLFDPPSPPKDIHPPSHLWGVKIDLPRVLIPMAVVLFVTIGAFVLTTQKSHKDEKQSK